MLFIIIP